MLPCLIGAENLITKDPDNFYHHTMYKFFESVTDCIKDRIFPHPDHSNFLLGNTLDKAHRDWRRAKNGLPNRYRLFFKFSSTDNAIVLAWLNDHSTLRKDGSKTDVYHVFQKMLNAGEIPTDFQALMKASSISGI